MKMKDLTQVFVTIFLLFSAFSYAQYDSIRVGIAPFYDLEKKNEKSDLILSELSDELSKYRHIKLIDRSQIKTIVEEIQMEQAGLLDEATMVEIGNIPGLEVVVTGTLRKRKITGRAVYLKTQRVIASTSVSTISEVDLLARKLASGIANFLTKENLKKLRNDSPNIHLEFWIERKPGAGAKGIKITPATTGNMKIGESIVFHFRTDKKGYLTIVDIQPGGDVIILFPNDLSPDNKISPGKVYSIPSEEDGYEITVSEPAGRDTLVAFFTEKKVDWLDPKKLMGEGFKSVKEEEKLAMTRGFKITATKLKRSEWESAVLEVDVVR